MELLLLSIWVQVKYHHMPIEDVFLQGTHDLHIRRVPGIEVLPHRRIKGLEVEMLYQVRLESLLLPFGNERV